MPTRSGVVFRSPTSTTGESVSPVRGDQLVALRVPCAGVVRLGVGVDEAQRPARDEHVEAAPAAHHREADAVQAGGHPVHVLEGAGAPGDHLDRRVAADQGHVGAGRHRSSRRRRPAALRRSFGTADVRCVAASGAFQRVEQGRQEVHEDPFTGRRTVGGRGPAGHLLEPEQVRTLPGEHPGDGVGALLEAGRRELGRGPPPPVRRGRPTPVTPNSRARSAPR